MLPKLFLGTDTALSEKEILSILNELYGAQGNTLQEFKHPEVYVIYAELGETIGIEEVREFLRFFRYKPVFAPIKTGIIFLADGLTEEAQNVLLKFLEEHPDYVQLVFAATTKDAVLSTIYSRMHPVFLKETKSLDGDSELFQLLQTGNYADIIKQLRAGNISLEDIVNTADKAMHDASLDIRQKSKVAELLNQISKWRFYKLSEKQVLDYTILALFSILKK